jgi:hypothetical protein
MLTIQLSEALNEMEMLDSKRNPQPFSISFYTCDRTRRTGGELRTIEKAVLTKHVKGIPRHAKGSISKKRVNEFENQIRNVLDTMKAPGDRVYTKVHIRLIEFFNGMKVVW